MKKILIYFIIFSSALILSSCLLGSEGSVSARGKIFKIEISSWMYGTHTLESEDGKLLYALTSDKINLDNYEGKLVKVEGDEVEGYPVDGGPILLDVKDVEEIK